MYFETNDLAVGYRGRALISGINLSVERGRILTLIGPNGAGKSTILKTITRHLEQIAGVVAIDNSNIFTWSNKQLAKRLSVMLTERVDPELMTCRQVVAMGRYPYTNYFGRLTPEDEAVVDEALGLVRATELGDCPFSDISDGQRQRILLARAICQQPEIIVLDEPTSYLDIRHKIELLDILRKMAVEKQVAVVMSLHELDLAAKVSDQIICVKGDRIALSGTPEEVFQDQRINALYELENGSFNALLGSVELARPKGGPQYFLLAGAGRGIPLYRELQKQGTAFSTGILFQNDVDYQVAKALAGEIIDVPAFSLIDDGIIAQAKAAIDRTKVLVDAGTPIGAQNACYRQLLDYAAEQKIERLSGEELLKRLRQA